MGDLYDPRNLAWFMLDALPDTTLLIYSGLGPKLRLHWLVKL